MWNTWSKHERAANRQPPSRLDDSFIRRFSDRSLSLQLELFSSTLKIQGIRVLLRIWSRGTRVHEDRIWSEWLGRYDSRHRTDLYQECLDTLPRIHHFLINRDCNRGQKRANKCQLGADRYVKGCSISVGEGETTGRRGRSQHPVFADWPKDDWLTSFLANRAYWASLLAVCLQ